MATIGDGVGPSNTEVLVPAFAKLQGENFEYYMRKYSIMLGRNSKKNSVDVDLRKLGGGMSISRHHSRIYYDFPFRCFALEVIGRNGCFIRNFPFMPGGPPIKLNSQDLLQIGEVRNGWFVNGHKPSILGFWDHEVHFSSCVVKK